MFCETHRACPCRYQPPNNPDNENTHHYPNPHHVGYVCLKALPGSMQTRSVSNIRTNLGPEREFKLVQVHVAVSVDTPSFPYLEISETAKLKGVRMPTEASYRDL